MALTNGQGQWPKEDIVMLLDLLEKNLLSNDSHTFKTTQLYMDWGKVAFKGYSGEMCKLKWLEISNKLRKFRTLTELVLEAKERVKNPDKSKKLKKHPDMPKKPLAAYLRFYKEKRLLYSQMHPKLRNQELTKVLSEKYRELPDQMRLKYIQDFQKEKREFEEKLAQFNKGHPDLAQNSRTSVVPRRSPTKGQKKVQGNVTDVKSPPETRFSELKLPGEPKKPPMHEYQKFHQDLWARGELRALPPRAQGGGWQALAAGPLGPEAAVQAAGPGAAGTVQGGPGHWLRSLSPEEHAAYRARTYAERENMGVHGAGPQGPEARRAASVSKAPQEGLAREQGPQAPGAEAAEAAGAILMPHGGLPHTKPTPAPSPWGMERWPVSQPVQDATVIAEKSNLGISTKGLFHGDQGVCLTHIRERLFVWNQTKYPKYNCSATASLKSKIGPSRIQQLNPSLRLPTASAAIAQLTADL
ncbi:PREDICTED: upstream-binding factor 1-like protein 1 [Miniopterus natalensis]|uniref:upstream-binding factor 1-like protein 1 n=1 Tax=Miniopterus natalensis TaxID=291302 RepID=UPI0007A70C4F|nr:PREDICTED: upstream-binding factor 1-like protein 1 [Miniopterus natalensis]